MHNKVLKFFLYNRLFSALLIIFIVGAGLITAPFNWDIDLLPRDRVPVDAIPDLGENQQIVFTEWPGRSPRDIEDQITYPLSSYLLGIPGVKSIRSNSVFGFSSIYLIFEEDYEFYWTRTRILEKLNALPADLLPEGISPSLGPDATALGQVFWYTLEGRDSSGQNTGGWNLQELRSLQDFFVKYALSSSPGVAEVASIGGFVKEYQVDLNPAALEAHGIKLSEVMRAIQESNRDLGAKTLELNKVEYLVRGIGYIKSISDLEEAVVKNVGMVPIRIKDIATVKLGPANRRGVLDKDGSEVVGGVVVARQGANPMEVIEALKAKINEISPGLPSKTLADGRESQVEIVPFYDRSGLIQETLYTLEEALNLEILITILVILLMVFNLRASLLVSSLLPLAVLLVFVAMRFFGTSANIVALSGIAIAIGTMVDLGVILSENMLKIRQENPNAPLGSSIYEAAAEVSGAILTAVSTTILSFIPVFSLEGAEGKLFGPLAYTKTFALIAALIVCLLILPTLAYWFFGLKSRHKVSRRIVRIALILLGATLVFFNFYWAGLSLIAFSLAKTAEQFASQYGAWLKKLALTVVILAISFKLSLFWLPLGPGVGSFLNILFTLLLLSLILGGFYALIYFYPRLLNTALNHRKLFLSLVSTLIVWALFIWLGFSTIVGGSLRSLGLEPEQYETKAWFKTASATFPGLGSEFMPSLDEGSFLLMPTTMPHSGIEFNSETLAQLDRQISSIPEVDLSVGKLGRVNSALDPAPISMFENVILYKPEYRQDEEGRALRYLVNSQNEFVLRNGQSLTNDAILEADLNPTLLQEDPQGNYFRNWRSKIQSRDDIWEEILSHSQIPGLTSAPKLQPIETRLVMLQTGMRAPMGIKVFGPSLEAIEDFGMQLESILKNVPELKAEAVFADRVIGKPYLHLELKRKAMARYGLSINALQNYIEATVGGKTLSYTVEGRERYAIRIRYPRELRDNPNQIGQILIPGANGQSIPLQELVQIKYVQGPQSIKSENTFLVSYVLFDRAEGISEMEAVEAAQNAISSALKRGEIKQGPGISYKFSGSYENQIRANKRLSLIVPLVLGLIFLILYLQFKSVATSLMVFSGIAVAFSGGFIMLHLYGIEAFLNLNFAGQNLRDIFQIDTINLSVAVWVGFIALFGIATDDGVLMATYLDQSLKTQKPKDKKSLRESVISAGTRRIRPAVMTSATTLIALLPILSSSGKGSDIMIPMAIPAFGGMLLAVLSYFLVPMLYEWRAEYLMKRELKNADHD